MPPSKATMFSTFSYGFHFKDSLRAIAMGARVRERSDLTTQIASSLSQGSGQTRMRLAQKIVQRYFPSPSEGKADSLFLQLVRGIRQAPTQKELLFFELCKTDSLVGAIARSIFHSYFVQTKVPTGFTSQEFRVLNGGELIRMRKVITNDFVNVFAARVWNFDDARCVGRSLHILEEADVVQKVKLTEIRNCPTAYVVAPRDVSLPAFLYALYSEFLPSHTISLRKVTCSRFARTFVLWPEQVNQLATAAARHQFLDLPRAASRNFPRISGPTLYLRFDSVDELVDSLLRRFGV